MKPPVELTDSFGRVHRDLRISVTDRCNFRCTYCMPEEGMQWLDRDEVLTFEEIERVARVLRRAVRLRLDPPDRRRADRAGPPAGARRASWPPSTSTCRMTTNGATLALVADDLAAAGLRRVNVSLDSLRRERFADLTRRDVLDRVLEGIDAALAAGLTPVKVNAVVVRGVNDDEVVELAAFGRERGVVGPLHRVHAPRRRRRLASRPGRARRRDRRPPSTSAGRSRPRPAGHEPARRWRYLDGAGEIGVIPSVTDAFCSTCDRVRLTADGPLRACLFAIEETDLRGPLRAGRDRRRARRARPRRRSPASGPATGSREVDFSGPAGRCPRSAVDRGRPADLRRPDRPS